MATIYDTKDIVMKSYFESVHLGCGFAAVVLLSLCAIKSDLTYRWPNWAFDVRYGMSSLISSSNTTTTTTIPMTFHG